MSPASCGYFQTEGFAVKLFAHESMGAANPLLENQLIDTSSSLMQRKSSLKRSRDQVTARNGEVDSRH